MDNGGWNGGYGNVMKAGEFETLKTITPQRMVRNQPSSVREIL